MTDESMLYEKMDMLCGLYATLSTEVDKDLCHALMAGVLADYKHQNTDLIITGSIPAAAAGVESVKAHAPALTQ
ncbi:hypothetical protein [Shewanella sp. GutCb]|uniref:hypothetical protein n=1 Tax=Shewanella sp. GutCb TaxID=2058315 RepID=UPI0015E0A71C|nr:hypothetical protein [Shewanella sp. GutCb]